MEDLVSLEINNKVHMKPRGKLWSGSKGKGKEGILSSKIQPTQKKRNFPDFITALKKLWIFSGVAGNFAQTRIKEVCTAPTNKNVNDFYILSPAPFEVTREITIFIHTVTIVENVVVFRNEVQTPGQEEEDIGIVVVDSNCIGDVCAPHPLAGHPRKGWRPSTEPNKRVIGEDVGNFDKDTWCNVVAWRIPSTCPISVLANWPKQQIGQNSKLANT